MEDESASVERPQRRSDDLIHFDRFGTADFDHLICGSIGFDRIGGERCHVIDEEWREPLLSISDLWNERKPSREPDESIE
jgi:hypothetical protein